MKLHDPIPVVGSPCAAVRELKDATAQSGFPWWRPTTIAVRRRQSKRCATPGMAHAVPGPAILGKGTPLPREALPN